MLNKRLSYVHLCSKHRAQLRHQRNLNLLVPGTTANQDALTITGDVVLGGIVGGVLLETHGAGAFPWALLALLVVGLLIAWASRGHGFPARPGVA